SQGFFAMFLKCGHVAEAPVRLTDLTMPACAADCLDGQANVVCHLQRIAKEFKCFGIRKVFERLCSGFFEVADGFIGNFGLRPMVSEYSVMWREFILIDCLNAFSHLLVKMLAFLGRKVPHKGFAEF